MDVFTYLEPDNYEMEEWSRPDEMGMFQGFWMHAQAELDGLRKARIADLCCGTGMSLLGMASHPNIASAVGVDIEERNIAFCRSRFQTYRKVSFVLADVLKWLATEKDYDLLTLSSAFHHIDHPRQQHFADLICGALKPGAKAIFAENIVAPFEKALTPGYMKSVTAFYDAVHDAAVQSRPNIPNRIKKLIKENVTLAERGEVEFKVCRPHFVKNVENAGMKLVYEDKCWPMGRTLPGNAGNFVFVFEKL